PALEVLTLRVLVDMPVSGPARVFKAEQLFPGTLCTDGKRISRENGSDAYIHLAWYDAGEGSLNEKPGDAGSLASRGNFANVQPGTASIWIFTEKPFFDCSRIAKLNQLLVCSAGHNGQRT